MANETKPAALERAATDAYRRGDLHSAADGFRQARSAFEAQGATLRAAEMANNLCVALIGLGRGREALESVEGTPRLFEQAGDSLQAARATGNRAAALAAVGRSAEAIADYRQAIERFHALGARDDEAATWQALSRLQLQSGDPLAAAASAQASLDAHPRPGPLRRIVRGMVDRALRLTRG